MKSSKSKIIYLFTYFQFQLLCGQNIQTDTLKVFGNCEMCKARIERAVFKKGVIAANWSPKSKLLIVKYKREKISLEDIKKSILNAGHDLENELAPDSIYQKLHSCCKYRDEN
jgi:copper chaperone CopZ